MSKESHLTNTDETSVPKIDHLNENYKLGHAKRSAETLCFLARELSSNRIINIARLFSFVGPHLPLDVHYAIGNFLGEALLGGPINLKSDGTAIRSFMYIADAVVCIFKSLLLDINSSHPLHIGSEHALSIKDTAYLIASLTDCEVNLGTNTTTTNSPAPNFYVPSTARTRDLLEVSEWTSILESIEKIIRWLSIKQ